MRLIGTPLTAVLIAAAVLAAACGGDGDDGGNGGALSAADYFRAMEGIQNDAAAKLDEAQADSEAALDGSPDELARSLHDTAHREVAVIRDAAAAMDALDPPDEAEDSHREFVAAVTAVADALDAASDTLPEQVSPSDLDAALAQVYGDADLAAAGQQATDSCNALQAIADKTGVDVDLDCESG